MVTTELDVLERENAELLMTLEVEYQDRLGEETRKCRSATAGLEDTNRELTEALRTRNAQCYSDVEALRQQLDCLRSQSEQDIENARLEREAEAERVIDEMQSQFERVECELREKLERSTAENESTLLVLRNELQALKDRLRELDLERRRRMDAMREGLGHELAVREQRIAELSEQQKTELEMRTSQDAEDLAEAKRTNQELATRIERELLAVATQVDQQQVLLETKVAALIKRKTGMEEEYGRLDLGDEQTPAGKGRYVRRVLASIEPNRAEQDKFLGLSSDELRQRTEKFEQLVNARLTEHRDLRIKRETELKKMKLAQRDQLYQENLHTQAILDEKRISQKNCELMAAKLNLAIQEEKARQRRIHSELKVKVAMQADTIRQLTESIQLAKVDELKRVQVSLAQADHREVARQLVKDINGYEDMSDKDNQRLEELLKAKLEAEKEKAEAAIHEATEQLAVALGDLQTAKVSREETVMKEWQKWMELRTDIAESNIRVLQLFEKKHLSALSSLSRLTPVSRRAQSRGMSAVGTQLT
jgi:hypothetical protein